jgi:hypothetical protein
MSASSTTLRLITVLFLLAGILLLRKPVLGQTKVTSPQIRVPHPFAVLPRSGVPNKGSCSLGWDRVGYSRRQAQTALLPRSRQILTTPDGKQANSTHLPVN